MKNFDNSLRFYNRHVLRRKRMHLYTKKYMVTLFTKALYYRLEIPVSDLPDETINLYKTDFDDSVFDEPQVKRKTECEPTTEPTIEPTKVKKPKLNNEETDVLKLVLSREGETFKSQFKSKLNNDKDVVVSSTNISPPPILSENTQESTESINSVSLVGKIKICDVKSMLDETYFEQYLSVFASENILNPTAIVKNNICVSVIPSPNVPINTVVVRGNLSLSEVENLYNKYFSRVVQDTIAIIANILNIISMSNKHHKSRMDESFKKRTEAEKLKERCDANRLHARHKNSLEAKLKKNFMDVVSLFVDSEFEPAFQMFFLSILTVLRVLDQPKFKKGTIFKNLVLLLWNSLKNSEFDHPKVFALFRNKQFRPGCIELISLIEDSRDNDPGITDRMALFFVSAVNSQEFFQPVIDAVTTDSNEDLGILIDNAAYRCRLNSKFKDPAGFTSSEKNSVIKTLLTTVQNPVKSNDTSQHWMISKTTNGGIRPVSISSESRPQTTTTTNIILEPVETSQPLNATSQPLNTTSQPLNTTSQPLNTTSQPLNTTSQPLNTYYENFSSSLLTNVSSESAVTPKVIPTNVSAVPTISKGSLVRSPALLTFKPSTTFHNLKPITTSIQKQDGNTFLLCNNKPYQLVRGTVNQIKGVPQCSNNSLIRLVRPVENYTMCYAKNCNNSSTIMCSTCTSVKYCTHQCQRSDWYDSHIHNCGRLRAQKRQSS